MFPAFTNAALLAGLAGVAAPVLIHLLLRRRSQRLRFSTVQFFVKKDEQSMRKRKLRNLFLLSLRVLLFVLLVMAFARPYLPSGAAGAATKRRQAILLLDASASMQGNGSGGPQWTRARTAAREILSHLGRDDRAALVLGATRSTTISGFVPPSVLAKKIDDIAPGFGTADLSEGFQQVLKVMTTANPADETMLHVISDLQRNGTQNIPSVALPRELKVNVSDPGERFAGNVSVTDLRLERAGDAGPRVTITSFSDENYSALPYRLTIDNREVLAGSIALAGGGSTNLPLAIPALKPGWHSAEFSVQARDALPLDDTRYGTLLVPDPIRCLVVEPRQGVKSYREESFFVTAALNPTAAGTASASRFVYEKIRFDELPAKLQPKAGQADVRLVVLPGLRQLPAAGVAGLKTFMERGGGVLAFLGDEVSANTYNSGFGGCLPVELGKTETADDKPWRLGPFKATSPAFALFQKPENGNLSLHEFTTRFAVKPKADALVLAQFEDGVPVVVERKVGEGRMMLVNSSADTRWTDWPKHKSFVPWLHASAFYLSGQNPVGQRETAPVFTSGSEVDLAVSLKEQAIQICREGGEPVLAVSSTNGVLRDIALDRPGIYSVRDKAGGELRRIAVNMPVSESDLTFSAPAEIEQQIVRQNTAAPEIFAAGLFTESAHGRELWRLLLVSALVFAIVEPLVANRTAA